MRSVLGMGVGLDETRPKVIFSSPSQVISRSFDVRISVMAEATRGSYDVSKQEQRYFVTRESQEGRLLPRKLSYTGMRDLSNPELIKEIDIIGPRGTIRGVKNRVRAGLANFQNPAALSKRSEEGERIVVYMSSFRGVRSTFEECKYVLSVFHNLRVAVKERDVYVHRSYHSELEERLCQSRVSVPQVFISGQHIGGASELEQLNETGELRTLLEDFPRNEKTWDCTVCGGYGLVPCHRCGGSKNSTANSFTKEFRALRCTHCNENGLEPCSHCPLKEKGRDSSEGARSSTKDTDQMTV